MSELSAFCITLSITEGVHNNAPLTEIRAYTVEAESYTDTGTMVHFYDKPNNYGVPKISYGTRFVISIERL